MENTNASIVILKTGSQIICSLKELFDGEEDNRKGVCLLMIHPYELSLVATNSKKTQQDLQVKFSRWCPYSSDYQFKIPYDSVMAVGAVDPNLEQAYNTKIEQVTQAISENSNSLQEEMTQVINPEVVTNE
jgi:hypothetical protein